MDEEVGDEFLKAIKVDQENFNGALDRLIESVSSFKAQGSEMLTDVEDDQWIQMQINLDYAKFILSGIMYSYGLPLCDHDHSEEDE